MGINGRKRGENKGILHARRNAKREAAEVRQAQRDLRSTEEQLKLLDSRPGASRREKNRLKEGIS